ncbi:MAG TPA: glycosyltransferase family A protein [Candidatus Binataceae bacterium]
MKKRCLAITPARDEQDFLPRLIASMAAQTCSPARWIIIDDGSSDATPSIIDEAAGKYSWIESHHLPAGRPRAPGGESVIMQFLPRETWACFDFILRLDSDISFGSDFIEQVLAEFAQDPKLGLAGATLCEPCESGWREIRGPSFHTRGAAKVYSRACFAAIGGLDAGLGWDTVDEAHAMMLGFTTRSFGHIRAYHHRPQGTAGGQRRGRVAAGMAAYKTGYSPLFVLARAARATFSGFPAAGVFLLAGYIEGHLRREKRIASPELVKFIRKQQLRRILLLNSLWR